MIERVRRVETDPLDAIRVELVAAARRRAARHRTRRRRVIAATASLIVALGLAAGASAINDFSTGVPAIDALLDVESPSLVGEPGPGGATEALSVPTNDGPAQALAYLSSEGTICHAQARQPRVGGAPVGGAGGCFRPIDLAKELARDGVVWSALSAGPGRRVFSGYADGTITRIEVLGMGGEAEVRMTEPWTPRAPNSEALRFLVVIDETDVDVGADGLQPDELTRLPREFPILELTYDDGRTVQVSGR